MYTPTQTPRDLEGFIRNYYAKALNELDELAFYFPDDERIAVSAMASQIGKSPQSLRKMAHTMVSCGFATYKRENGLAFLYMALPLKQLRDEAWQEWLNNPEKYKRKERAPGKTRSYVITLPESGDINVTVPREKYEASYEEHVKILADYRVRKVEEALTTGQ